ncbi:MAG: undecaprenyl-diphosphate phosphatase [Deltaproteobacteria bacterium]|nr:undecaprenyl-diphosphate phosphatase [Deltaproteobacteria bacterium]
MSLHDAVILGIVQGLTEFLPVSSSGHLVLGGHLLGLKEPHLLFEIVLHVATLIATLLFYRASLVEMARDSVRALGAWRRGSLQAALAAHPAARLVALIAVGSLPTAAVGLTFRRSLEAMFASPALVAAMLLVTAALLLSTRWAPAAGRGVAGMRWRDALLIGLAQGIAIAPGISRSGATIGCALLLGLDRELAARYSFLLAVPAILGALVLKLAGAGPSAPVDLAAFASGFVAALLVGMLALAALIPVVRRGKLSYFAAYLVPVGVAGVILLW